MSLIGLPWFPGIDPRLFLWSAPLFPAILALKKKKKALKELILS